MMMKIETLKKWISVVFYTVYGASVLQVITFVFISCVFVWLIFLDQHPENAQTVAKALNSFAIWTGLSLLCSGIHIGKKLFKKKEQQTKDKPK